MAFIDLHLLNLNDYTAVHVPVTGVENSWPGLLILLYCNLYVIHLFETASLN